jgi:hypothetical protein
LGHSLPVPPFVVAFDQVTRLCVHDRKAHVVKYLIYMVAFVDALTPITTRRKDLFPCVYRLGSKTEEKIHVLRFLAYQWCPKRDAFVAFHNVVRPC